MSELYERTGRKGLIFRKNRAKAALINVSLLFFSGQAMAEGTQLAPPQAGTVYAPDEPLRFALSADVISNFQGRFALEIDRVDVSDLLSISGSGLVYAPVSPLTSGTHTLRLYELRKDEPPLVLGEWEVEVGGPQGAGPEGEGASPLDLTLVGQVDVEARRRLASNNLTRSSDPTALSGAAQLALEAQQGRVSVSFSGNAFLESEKALSLTGNVLDAGEYLADIVVGDEEGAGGLKAGLRLGHHGPATGSLIMSNYFRRGVSAWVSGFDGGLEASAFSVADEALVGGRDPLGQQSRSGHLRGFTLGTGALDFGPGTVKLSGIYYTGEEAQDFSVTPLGEGEEALSTAGEGDGWSGRLETRWLDGRLMLAGEHARSNLDEDGQGALAEESASATLLSASYDVLRGTSWGDDPVSLIVGADWYEIDTFFGSLGNPGVAADKEGASAFAQLQSGGMSLNFSARDETNNVDGLAGLPTERLRFLSLSGTYYPQIERENEEELAWLGEPYLTFGASGGRIDRDKTPIGYQGPDTDNDTWTVYGGIGSYYGPWSWGLTQTRSVYEDRTDALSDTRNDLTDISASWAVSDRLNLTSGLQFGIYEERQSARTSRQVNWLANIDAEIIPGTLNGALNYNLNLLTGGGDTPDRNVLSGELEWILEEASETRPRLSLALRGAVETNNGYAAPTDNESRYETYAVFRIQAPVRYR